MATKKEISKKIDFVLRSNVHHGSSLRNREPILEVLQSIFEDKPGNQVLEISSGTGAHVELWSQNYPKTSWQPTEYNPDRVTCINDLFKDKEKWANIKTATNLDCSTDYCTSWGFDTSFFDLIVNCNMIHISPWEATVGLFKGAGKALKQGGHLITYGPYKINGVLSPQSNVMFDQSLQQRNPEWGIREINECKNLALQNQLTFVKKISMPANNFVVIYIKN